MSSAKAKSLVSEECPLTCPPQDLRLLEELVKAAENGSYNLSQFQALVVFIAQYESVPPSLVTCNWILQMSKDLFNSDKNKIVKGKGNISGCYRRWMEKGYSYSELYFHLLNTKINFYWSSISKLHRHITIYIKENWEGKRMFTATRAQQGNCMMRYNRLYLKDPSYSS